LHILFRIAGPWIPVNLLSNIRYIPPLFAIFAQLQLSLSFIAISTCFSAIFQLFLRSFASPYLQSCHLDQVFLVERAQLHLKLWIENSHLLPFFSFALETALAPLLPCFLVSSAAYSSYLLFAIGLSA
jgi:hypothetical protein